MTNPAATRTAGRLLAALAFLFSVACVDNGVERRPLASGTPSVPVAVTPRPPGPPLYYPLPHFKGPDPVDVKFALSVTPYHGLTYGSRFTMVMTYTSNERRAVTINPNVGFGDQIIVKVVDSGGGVIQRMDNHDTATGDEYPFIMTGVDFPNFKLEPGVTKVRVMIEIVGVKCPGGGDFVTEVAGGVGRVVKRGSNGGRHLLWIENDARDYATKRVAEGTSDPVPPHPVCRPQSVE